MKKPYVPVGCDQQGRYGDSPSYEEGGWFSAVWVFVLVLVTLIVLGAGVLRRQDPAPCWIAEISPDVPTRLKEACRK